MICGYAILYGELSRPFRQRGFLYEKILPGAFSESVRSGRTRSGEPIQARLNHRRFLASTEGRLKLAENDRGVSFELAGDFRLPANFVGMSFSFRPLKWSRRGNLFLLHGGDLREISICTRNVAYPQTAETVKEIQIV